ncbi:murein L,D-transpeptidase [Algimonas porphyrae]|uniref:Murein L,D-transpeptidase n=1 Tax=Algimonas porphyrae TaxID=1128113 RepID=A0ABQ5UY40_9PROT|nr:L,D-transpeptidase family protein [Algimonas porphyrae]GLQ20201.1 murein L,D-transpeptidase [Algimonas porphyrae]
MKRILASALVLNAFAAGAFATAPGPLNPLAPKAMLAYTNGSDVVPGPAIPQADLIAALESVVDHGLDPTDYHLALIRDKGTSGEMALYAVDAWMSAASHIAFGKLSPTSVEPDWTAKGRQADLVASLRGALAEGQLAGSLDALAPQHSAYQSLVTEMRRRRSAPQTNDIEIPSGETLKPGMSSPRVETLQRRLSMDPTGQFDTATADAVMTFQSENGLDADGLVGPATLRALNRGSSQAIDQLRVNLERWRWLADDLGRRHVRVNIADFSVQAWQDGAIHRVHGAIVGRPYRKTPVFSDQIRYVVLNPWWETPASLARRDKLPLFQKDPAAVKRLGFQVLDRSGAVIDASTVDWKAVPAGTMPYRIRQAPGDQNALGQVKIMFPNSHNVYLHDTPNRGLFAQRQRAFSSGCIRTQDPIDLTEWLLSETPDWNRTRIDAALDGGRETRANLSQPVPVHILYMTAVSDASGVRYLDDIYDRDGAVLAGLKKTAKTR